jgi:hypothetical protein
MVRLIQTLALGAALVTLATCIWRDYGVLAALPRVVVAYLAAFFLGAVIALGGRLLTDLAAKPAPPPPDPARKPATRRRQNRAPAPAPEEPAAAPAASAPDAG